MFDQLVENTAGASGADGVGAWARVESAACARRLAAMVTMLDDAHAAAGSADREQWYLDNWAAVCAHIGAVQRLTSGSASGLLMVGSALRDRFPRVAALFAEGLIDYRLVRTIVYRSMLVTDPAALRALDKSLAESLRDWEPMSVDKAERTIDALIDGVDPHAVRRTQNKARSRSVDVHVEDGSGLAALFGTLFAHDATALDRRLDALADTVCASDPRTRDQHRADAMGALAHGADHLACLCQTKGCPAVQSKPSSGVVIHLVAHHDTIAGPAAPDDSDPEDPPGPGQDDRVDQSAGLDGLRPPLFSTPLREMTLTEAFTDSDPGHIGTIRPAVIVGGPFLPGAIARRAALLGTVAPIVHPGQAPPERHYRPSKTLADFVRCRDLTCRYPGCHEPATNTDIEHTIPWPAGPTCASNLKCLCRKHHLLKTFWVGDHGWLDKQLPDGTVVWTTPDGRTHSTTPGSRLLFPSLCRPTASVAATAVPSMHTPGLRMPRRPHDRTQDRIRRIESERELNRLAAAEEAGHAVPEPVPPF